MALATRRPLLYSLFDIIIELFALTKHCESSWEEGKIRGGGRLLLFFHKRSKSRGIEISGSFKRARSAREGSWTASRGLNSGCYRGLLAPPAPTCTNATTCHLERGGGGGERRQSGALEKRLSAVKNAAELLVCLARYKRPGSWCAFRNKHAATARPPVLWAQSAQWKKRKKRSGKKPSTVLFFLFLHLLFWPSLTSHNLVSVFRGLNLDKSFFLSFSFSKKKYRSGECFSPRRIFRWNNRRGLKNLKISRRSVSLLFLAIMVMDKSLRNKSELPLRK